jgi:hypothetical protein
VESPVRSMFGKFGLFAHRTPSFRSRERRGQGVESPVRRVLHSLLLTSRHSLITNKKCNTHT